MASGEALLSQIIKCSNFAAIKHKNQRRKDPESTPYINHPIGVAYILTNEGKITDLSVIQAALLHDTVEDTDTTLDEIKEQFGDEVAGLVDEVSDDKSLSKMERKNLQIKNAPHKSYKAKLIKLADKLYNLRDLKRATPEGWSEERVQEYFVFAFGVVAGLRGINDSMERELDKLFKERSISDS